MAEQVGARVGFVGLAVATCLMATFGLATGQESATAPDAPALPQESAPAGENPAAPSDHAAPFQDLVPEELQNPLDDENLNLPDNLDSDLDAADLGSTPAETSAPGGTEPSATPTEPPPPPSAPEPLPAGTGFQGFYALENAPNFIYNTDAFNLPYTIQPTASLGRGRTRVGPFRLGINLSLSSAYNDNVFGSSTDRQGDIVSSLTPSLYLQAGTRGSFRLLYTPSFQIYQRFKSQNSTNETLLLSSTYKFTKLSIGGDFSYTTRSGLFPDSQSTADQATYNLSLFANYRLGAKTQVRLTYDGSLQDSNPGGTSTTNALTASSVYALTSRVGIGGGLTAGYVDSEANQQSFMTLNATGNWKASSRLQFSAAGGVQARQLSLNQANSRLLVSPVFSLSAGWRPFTHTSLNLNLFRNISTNGFDTVQTNIITGMSFGVSQSLWKKVNVQLSTGISYYEQENPNGTQSEDYSYAFGNLSLGYQLRSFLNINVFWNFQQRFSEAPSGEYYTNVVGLSLGTAF